MDERRLANLRQGRLRQPPQAGGLHGDMRHLPGVTCQPGQLQVDHIAHQGQRHRACGLGVVQRVGRVLQVRQPRLGIAHQQRGERGGVASIGLRADPAQRRVHAMGAAENVQIPGQHHLIGHFRNVLMGHTQRLAGPVVGFEYPVQPGLDIGTQFEGFRNLARHLAVHHGEGGRLVHRAHRIGA
ncbi:hypothetical protein D9M69_349330 [compost metagenome]